jgi:hypothetical protein
MTIAKAQAAARHYGCSIRSSNGEFRVNLSGGKEATAYYTNCLDDAVATARAMALEAKGA